MDAAGCIVYPGLINTHHHLYQTFSRNLPAVQGMELFDWLRALYEIHAAPGGEHADTQLLRRGPLQRLRGAAAPVRPSGTGSWGAAPHPPVRRAAPGEDVVVVKAGGAPVAQQLPQAGHGAVVDQIEHERRNT